MDRVGPEGLMCPSRPSTLSSAPGHRLSTSDPNVRDCLRGLLARIEALGSSRSSLIVAHGSSGESCLLPLSRSQSRLLADLVTTFVPRSTWWLTQEESESWVLCGSLGEDSGPQLTVFISATSDRDVVI